MDPLSTPDSWEQNDDGGSGDQENINQISKGLGGLNVNATPFIPGQNVYAKEFVPSFGNNSTNNTGTEYITFKLNSHLCYYCVLN